MDLLRDAWDEFGSTFHEGLFLRWKQEGDAALRSELQVKMTCNGRFLRYVLPFNYDYFGSIDASSGSSYWPARGDGRQKCTVTPVSTTLCPGRDWFIKSASHSSFAKASHSTCGFPARESRVPTINGGAVEQAATTAMNHKERPYSGSGQTALSLQEHSPSRENPRPC